MPTRILLALLLALPLGVLAAPPDSPYAPGETLTPACAPGTTNCTVQMNTAPTVTATDTEVMFNDDGTMAGMSGFTFSSSSGMLHTPGLETSFASTSALSLGSLTGFLKATAGAVAAALIDLGSDVTGTLLPLHGGTGLASAPTYGQLLAGNGTGGYTGLATSSLGLLTTSVAEGSNKYYTDARVQSLLDSTQKSYFFSTTSALAWLGGRSTDDLPEGTTSQYFTEQRVDDRVAALLQAGAGTHLSYDPSGHTLTVSSTGGGGGGTDVNWSYFAGSLTPATTTNQVVIGGTSTTSLAKLQVTGGATFDAATTTRLAVSNAASIASLIVSGPFTYGTSTGILKAASGAVSSGLVSLANEVTGVLQPGLGGTGLSSAPSYGSLLMGDGLGGYSSLATSSLGLLTTSVAEGTNKYYTDARVQTLLDSLSKGYFFSTTSAQYLLSQSQGLAFSTTSADYWKGQSNFFSTTSADAWLTGKSTTNLAEGTNQYFTLARARGALSSAAPALSYDSSSGIFSLASGYDISRTASTSAWESFYQNPSMRIVAGTNLSWNGSTLNGLSTTSIRSLFQATAPALYDASTGTLSLTQASGNSGGYLSSSDWSLFSSRLASTSLSAGSGISYSTTTGVIANSGVTGLSGTANQVSVSGSSGSVTLSLPSTLSLASASASSLSSNIFSAGQTGTTSIASTGVLSTPGLVLATLSGVLRASSGTVSTGLVNLASEVTGTLPVANGGTGTSSPYGLLRGTGSALASAVSGVDYQSPLSVLYPLSLSGNVLSVAASSSSPVGTTSQLTVYQSASFGSTATSTFSSDGSLSLSAPLPTVSGGTGWSTVQNGALLVGNGTSKIATTTAATAGQVLSYLGGTPTWTATTTFSAPLSFANGVVSISPGTVTNNLLATPSISLSAGSGLLGGGTVTLGGTTSLSLDLSSANTWNALQQFGNASTTLLSVSGTGFFGSASNSFFSSGGDLTLGTLASSPMILAVNSVGKLVGSSTPTVSAFYATSTSATSTLAGGLSAANGAFAVLASNGRVGIGTLAPGYPLDVRGDVGGVVAKFQTAGGSLLCALSALNGQLACSSDERLKTDIEPLASSTLDAVLALAPVSYRWKTDPSDALKKYGFIAQAVQKIFPELVSTDPATGYETLSLNGMVPYVVKALQEEHDALFDRVRGFLADSHNGIDTLFTHTVHADQICLSASDGSPVCVTGDQLKAFVNAPAPQTAHIAPAVPDVPAPQEEAATSSEDASQGSYHEPDTAVVSPAPDAPATSSEPQAPDGASGS